MPGYGLKVNGEYARIESLLCPYCSLILKEAIQTEQGVRLCLSCYQEIQRDSKVLKKQKFPDIELDPKESYHPDKAVRREVDKIPVKCKNQELGCAWTGTLVEHEKNHQQVCQYKSEECPNHCGERLLIDKIHIHLSKHCPLRDIQCQYCRSSIKARDSDDHILSCPQAPFNYPGYKKAVLQTEKDDHIHMICKASVVCFSCDEQRNHQQVCQYKSEECPNHCGERLLIDKMHIHLSKHCPLRDIQCQYCRSTIKAKDSDDHILSCPQALFNCPAYKEAVLQTEQSNCQHLMIASGLPLTKQFKERICEQESEGHKYHPDTAVRSEVDKIPEKCKNQELGCAWTEILVEHEKNHQQVCQYKSEECPNHCGKRLLIDKIHIHLSKHCPLRDIQCPYCHSIIKARDADDHILSCPQAPFDRLACNKAVLQTEIQNCPATIKKSSNGEVERQRLGLRIKSLKRKIHKRCDELSEAISSGSQTSEQMQSVRKELIAMKEDLKEKYSTETERIMRDLVRRVQDLEASTDKQTQIIRTLQSRSTTGPGFQSGLSLEDYSSDRVGQLEGKIAETDRQLAVLKVNISELELQLQASLASNYNGSFLWRIPDIKRRRRDALEGKITSIYSPPFYMDRNGYKMCVRAYLNGDGIGYNTHLSIFFVLMKGEYDPLLKWPFDHKVSLILVDQDHRRHIVQTFKPSPSSSSFQRPKSDMNIASGCPKFAELKVLDNESYVKEDVMYIKCVCQQPSDP